MLIKELGMNKNSFSKAIGAKPQTTHKIISNINYPGFEYLENILSTYSVVSAEWLILGTGDMLKNSMSTKPLQENEISDDKKTKAETIASPEFLLETIEDKKSIIENLREKIKTITQENIDLRNEIIQLKKTKPKTPI